MPVSRYTFSQKNPICIRATAKHIVVAREQAPSPQECLQAFTYRNKRKTAPEGAVLFTAVT